MTKRQIILRIIYVLMALIAIASVITYFVLVRIDKGLLAFYMAFGGGLLIINLIIITLFVRKNIK